MIIRLVKDPAGKYIMLCSNGTISEGTPHVLARLLTEFKNANKFSGEEGRWMTQHPDMSMYPGESAAIVTDNYDLVVYDQNMFADILDGSCRIHKYLTVEQYAQKHNKSREIIKVFCREGRLVGAAKKGGCWIIPEDTPYPVPPERRREGYRGPRKKHT